MGCAQVLLDETRSRRNAELQVHTSWRLDAFDDDHDTDGADRIFRLLQPLREIGRGAVRFIDPGATPTVSADGVRNGIVWAITSKGWRSPDRPAVLYAFDAANVANELWNSEQNAARDRAGMALRFSIPTVAEGRVYVGTKGSVEVYGLIR